MTEWSQPDQAERFVREYADPILRVCAAYSLGRSDAQDICQEPGCAAAPTPPPGSG